MKKNVWKELKKENNAQELNLAIEDIGYVNKVVVYAASHGVGIVETELIRKYLIGMGLEAKIEGYRTANLLFTERNVICL